MMSETSISVLRKTIDTMEAGANGNNLQAEGKWPGTPWMSFSGERVSSIFDAVAYLKDSLDTSAYNQINI
jgi:hypothetical protein